MTIGPSLPARGPMAVRVDVFECENCGALVLRAPGSRSPVHCYAPQNPEDPAGGGAKAATVLIGTATLQMERKV